MPPYPTIAAYTFLQPLKKVVRRVPNSAGVGYCDETLECGHTLLKQRGRGKRGHKDYYLPDHRRCPRCQPDPPPLLGVEVILDEAIPYVAGDGSRIGFHYVNEAGRVSLARTKRLRMHPDYHAQLPHSVFRRKRMLRGLCELSWVCELCGLSGKSPGGRATHYRVKHKNKD